MKKLYLILIMGLTVLLFSCTQNVQKGETEESQFTTELTQAEKDGGILTPEILWKFGRVSDPQISPDK